MIEAVLQAIEQRDVTAYEMAVAAAQALVAQADGGRWQLAVLAEALPKNYGKDTLGRFAKDIGIGAATLREYRRVWRAAQNVAGAAFLTAYPALTYSHWREMARLPAEQQSGFVEWMASEAVSVDAASVRRREITGARITSAKLLDIEVEDWQALPAGDGIVIHHQAFLETAELPAMLRIVIYAV